MIVLALLAFTPSGIISVISLITAALSSKSKLLSTLYLVIVLATPLECLPSNYLAKRLPNHLSKSGMVPLKKNSHTLQPGAQNPQPGPSPTGPVLNR
jgi:hypothetical protein